MIISPTVSEEIRDERIRKFKETYGSFKTVKDNGIVTNMAVTEEGIVINLINGEIMLPFREVSNFLSIVLEYMDGDEIISVTRKLAKVVAETYIPNPDKLDPENLGNVICKNRNWLDCSTSNVMWGSFNDINMDKDVPIPDNPISIPREKSYIPYCYRAIPGDLVGFTMPDGSDIPPPPFKRRAMRMARKGIITSELHDFLYDKMAINIESDPKRVNY